MLSRLAPSLALVAAVPANAAPISAPTQPPARASVVVPLVVNRIQDLSFGTIIPGSDHLAVVVIDPNTGARTGNATLIASDAGRRGYFEITGTPGHRIGIDLAWPPELISENGDAIDLTNLTLDGAILRNLHAVTGIRNFGVGGRIEIAPDQPEGLYTATYDVVVWYN
jgi:hypothetical protein